MNPQREPVIHLARVVLEAATPLSVSTGQPDGVFDTALVTDANGLPALPGSSLAGVLRHLWIDAYGEASADELFGHQHGKEGQPSRVGVSWGTLLDSGGEPADGLLLGEEAKRLTDDPVLSAAAALIDNPVFRNRVHLTERGAAADQGKFDRAVLPAGHRFAVELTLTGADDAQWHNLLSLLVHPGLRAGGGTRAGLGHLQPVACYAGTFDRRNPEQASAFLSLPPGIAATEGLNSYKPEEPDQWLTGTLVLEAEGPWRIGQGIPDPDDPDKPADLLPVTEERVRWIEGTGRLQQRALLFPASALKGALAHRLAFHAHRFAGRWAEDDGADHAPEQAALFGAVKERARREDKEDRGRVGCLALDDAWLESEPDRMRVMHNAIDRFTGGVRDRVLFEEEDLLGGEMHLPVALDRQRLKRHCDECGTDIESVRRALSAALDDLFNGRLPLGSRTTIGNGVFRGRFEGPLGEWLAPNNKQTEAA